MPGFVDGHDHLIGGALTKVGVSLAGLEGKDAVVEAIRRYAVDHPARPVIRGHGWTPFTFGVGVQPHRTWLDAVTDVRPALMHTYDCHDGWANTAAFIAAGIDATTPDPNPPYGTWPRGADGFPMGTCCEPESWLPIAIALGMFSMEAVEEAMRLTLFPAPTWGITTYYDASPIVNTHKLALEVYERLIEIDTTGGGLPVRIVGSYAVRDPQMAAERAVSRLRQLHHEVRSPNLSITTLKLFMDGVGPQHTAALLQPYTDQPDNRGPFLFDPDVAHRHVEAANVAGFDVHMHACGDAGVRGALDAVERVQADHGHLAARNTVCHMELCHVDDIARFAELGVTANGTPMWGTDYRGEFMDAYPQLIGDERFNRDYVPYGSLLRSGALVTFGGDCPGVEIDEIAPLKQIEAAVTRQRPGRRDDRVCGPHERMSLADALRCYTINGARALRLEDEIGSIEVGKRADMVILAANPFDVEVHAIHAIEVQHTMLGGRFTHGGSF
jgi:predicted amidohydrolase YtcJ